MVGDSPAPCMDAPSVRLFQIEACVDALVKRVLSFARVLWSSLLPLGKCFHAAILNQRIARKKRRRHVVLSEPKERSMNSLCPLSFAA